DHARAIELISKSIDRWADNHYLHLAAALARLYMGDDRAALQHAQRSLDLYPRNDFALTLIRDQDLRAGRLDETRSRYQKAYPELFETPAPRIDRSNFFA